LLAVPFKLANPACLSSCNLIPTNNFWCPNMNIKTKATCAWAYATLSFAVNGVSGSGCLASHLPLSASYLFYANFARLRSQVTWQLKLYAKKIKIEKKYAQKLAKKCRRCGKSKKKMATSFTLHSHTWGSVCASVEYKSFPANKSEILKIHNFKFALWLLFITCYHTAYA